MTDILDWAEPKESDWFTSEYRNWSARELQFRLQDLLRSQAKAAKTLKRLEKAKANRRHHRRLRRRNLATGFGVGAAVVCMALTPVVASSHQSSPKPVRPPSVDSAVSDNSNKTPASEVVPYPWPDAYQVHFMVATTTDHPIEYTPNILPGVVEQLNKLTASNVHLRYNIDPSISIVSLNTDDAGLLAVGSADTNKDKTFEYIDDQLAKQKLKNERDRYVLFVEGTTRIPNACGVGSDRLALVLLHNTSGSTPFKCGDEHPYWDGDNTDPDMVANFAYLAHIVWHELEHDDGVSHVHDDSKDLMCGPKSNQDPKKSSCDFVSNDIDLNHDSYWENGKAPDASQDRFWVAAPNSVEAKIWIAYFNDVATDLTKFGKIRTGTTYVGTNEHHCWIREFENADIVGEIPSRYENQAYTYVIDGKIATFFNSLRQNVLGCPRYEIRYDRSDHRVLSFDKFAIKEKDDGKAGLFDSQGRELDAHAISALTPVS
jgi:hypothetical protein